MLDLNNLYYFTQIAHHGGYSAAARAMGQPKSKLSRRIVQLEERLGVRLIDRTGRNIFLTDAGRVLLNQAAPILAAAEDISSLASSLDGEPRGALRIASSAALAPLVRCRMRTFLADCPETRAVVTVLDDDLAPLDDRYDLVLRLGPGATHPGWSVRAMTVGDCRLVAAPAFLASLPARTAASLAMRARRTSPDPAGLWVLVAQAHDDQTPRLRTRDPDLIMAALEDGLGMALLPEFICGPALWDGRLSRVEHASPMAAPGVELATPLSRVLLPVVRAFADSLQAAFIGESAPTFVARTPSLRAA